MSFKYVVFVLNTESKYITFLPRDATQSAVLLPQVVKSYVRPSVCLSVMLRYHDHTVWKSSKI